MLAVVLISITTGLLIVLMWAFAPEDNIWYGMSTTILTIFFVVSISLGGYVKGNGCLSLGDLEDSEVYRVLASAPDHDKYAVLLLERDGTITAHLLSALPPSPVFQVHGKEYRPFPDTTLAERPAPTS